MARPSANSLLTACMRIVSLCMRDSLSDSERNALRALRSLVAHEGRFPSVRELMTALGFKSPRSASWLLDRLLARGLLERKKDGSLRLKAEPQDETACATTVNVPLLGQVTCGQPLLAEENVEREIPVSARLARPPYKYFLLRASGDSMDKAGIKNGELVLVRQQSVAQDGDSVVALINDEATIKEFHLTDGALVLQPRSTNAKHRPIVLTTDFQIQGVVVASFPEPTTLGVRP